MYKCSAFRFSDNFVFEYLKENLGKSESETKFCLSG